MTRSRRLNRFLAAAGIASRRRCDDLIREGRVSVNGAPVTELGVRIDPDADRVTLDGAPVRAEEGSRTLVLYKPREVLVASSDARGRRTVVDLLADVPVRVFPVGRLDYRSEGLLVLTNDGDLAYRLAHPHFKVAKLYHVEVEGKVSAAEVKALAAGVMLEDGPTQPARVTVLARRKRTTLLEIELREGRKRQIRRMLALFGHRVTRLLRVKFGPLEIGDLGVGCWRDVLPEEIEALRSAVDLDSSGAAGT
jgi:pseudouridine synthase